MIGVLSGPGDRAAVEEFFELFKTHWEMWQPGRRYDAVIACRDDMPEDPGSEALIVYGAGTVDERAGSGVELQAPPLGEWIEWQGRTFPIYGRIRVLGDASPAIARLRGTGGAVAVRIPGETVHAARVGFDLFDEVGLLLRRGQPPENAECPTLDVHIAFLRALLAALGVFFLEVLPAPPGYDFMACATHDVDFVGIRDHRFDHTMWGFLYRCCVGSLLDLLADRGSWRKCLRNWTAALKLPFVFLGVAEDFWLEFDRYCELEENLGSTFYFIPYAGVAGTRGDRKAPARRAAKYDLANLGDAVPSLIRRGCEVGVHGLDAWQDSRKGEEERLRVQDVAGTPVGGIRMHWLYWSEQSAEILENAGYAYDSTFGYNEAVGFRAGTTQVFRPAGARRLLELPLNIQDSALFYPERMNCTETEAFDICERVVGAVLSGGGVLTINWHTRSLSPERLWGDFYKALLNQLRAHRVWFATAGRIIERFRERRELTFISVTRSQDGITVHLSGGPLEPAFRIRFYHPRQDGNSGIGGEYTDVEWNGEKELFIPYPVAV